MRGRPAGIGGMPRSLNRASERQSVGQLTLALQDVDIDRRLVVDAGREHLASARRNRRIAQDDLRHHSAHRLDAEAERCDVEQQHLAPAADQDVGLHRRAQRHDLVGIQLAVRRSTEQLGHDAANERHSRGAADEDSLVDFRWLEPGIGQRLTNGLNRSLDERANQLLELARG